MDRTLRLPSTRSHQGRTPRIPDVTQARQLARVEAEEADVVLPRFDVTDAWALGCRMREAAAAAGLPIVIGITLGEARVFHTALPGRARLRTKAGTWELEDLRLEVEPA